MGKEIVLCLCSGLPLGAGGRRGLKTKQKTSCEAKRNQDRLHICYVRRAYHVPPTGRCLWQAAGRGPWFLGFGGWRTEAGIACSRGFRSHSCRRCCDCGLTTQLLCQNTHNSDIPSVTACKLKIITAVWAFRTESRQ